MQEHAFTIRSARAADAEGLVKIAASTYYETFAAVNTPENMQAYLASAFTLAGFTADLANPAVAMYVAESPGGLIGYAKLVAGAAPSCVTGDSPLELERLYVDARWHGGGVAKTLMETCLTYARDEGFKTIYLGVWERNFRAQSFYRKWGFERVGEHIFQMGDDPQIDWWMSRPV